MGISCLTSLSYLLPSKKSHHVYIFNINFIIAYIILPVLTDHTAHSDKILVSGDLNFIPCGCSYTVFYLVKNEI